MTAYEVAMNDTDLALASLERGLLNGYTAENCAQCWVIYKTMVDMYLTLLVGLLKRRGVAVCV